jgi:hypothetical protein
MLTGHGHGEGLINRFGAGLRGNGNAEIGEAKLPRVRSALLLAVTLALAALAGCSTPAAPAAMASTSNALPGTLGALPAASNGTGAAAVAPQWQVGQWWTWRIETASAPAPLEATTAVVAADAGAYQVGSAEPEKAAQLFPFHIVALGSVDRETLAWQAHGSPVQFLRFPLRDGDRFTADFWGAPKADVVLRAASVQGPAGPEPGFKATATYSGAPDAVFVEADWSLQRGQFVRVATRFGAEAPFATATLLDEGSGATAKPFSATELVRWSTSLQAPDQAAPRTFSVPADAQMVLFACFLGGAQGHFQATMALSDQQATTCQSTNPAGGGLHYSTQTRPAVAGAGEVAAVPAGQAGVTVEIFAVRTA